MGQKPGNQARARRVSRPGRPVRQRDRLFSKALALIEERLESQDRKTSLADLIRVLKISRELEGNNPGPVEARWVDAAEEAGPECPQG